jgi:hypothetical protein
MPDTLGAEGRGFILALITIMLFPFAGVCVEARAGILRANSVPIMGVWRGEYGRGKMAFAAGGFLLSRIPGEPVV